MKKIKEIINASITTKLDLLNDERKIHEICEVKDAIVESFKKGHKLLLCGNGGSAADAQHLASEFSGRYLLDRPALFAEALHSNVTAMTAISNDYGYEHALQRILESKAKQGDVLWALSTSGNSLNVVNALKKAKSLGVITVGLTGHEKSEMDAFCDHLIKVPSTSTPRIQECHMMIGHIICEIVELKLFNPKK